MNFFNFPVHFSFPMYLTIGVLKSIYRNSKFLAQSMVDNFKVVFVNFIFVFIYLKLAMKMKEPNDIDL